MRGKRAKILRKTAELLFNDDKFMSTFTDNISQRELYQLLKKQYKTKRS